MGRLLTPNRKYLYVASGTGLSPDINGLRFYDSGLIYNGRKSFYSENGQYAIWYWGGSPTVIWFVGPIANIGTFTTNNWGKIGATDTVAGSYFAGGDKVGTVTISEYKNNISIKKQNLSSLKPQEIYIYKSSDIKIIVNVFQILVGGYTLDVYEGGINGQIARSFISSGEGWLDPATEENSDGYTIPINSVITFTGPNNIVVGNGAIIQKYDSGKSTAT